jgi:hypothetical protein
MDISSSYARSFVINTDKPATWTVYGVEPIGDSWRVIATTWTPQDGPVEESRSLCAMFDTEGEAKGFAQRQQAGYDKVRRAALAGA